MIGQRGGRTGLSRRLFEDVPFFRVYESKIDIRIVVEFLAAKLAQTEHNKRRRNPCSVGILVIRLSIALFMLLLAKTQHSPQANVCQVREFKRDFDRISKARQVSRRQSHQFPPLKKTKLVQSI